MAHHFVRAALLYCHWSLWECYWGKKYKYSQFHAYL